LWERFIASAPRIVSYSWRKIAIVHKVESTPPLDGLSALPAAPMNLPMASWYGTSISKTFETMLKKLYARDPQPEGEVATLSVVF
jgi:hypothetical protein